MTFTWHVRSYYNDTVKPPKKPGKFAIEVGGGNREALSLDIEILKNRDDIGRIVLIDPNGNQEEL